MSIPITVTTSAAICAVELLCMHLHSLPGGLSPSKNRRGRSTSWLEAASVSADGELTLLFCCAWSAIPVTLIVRSDARTVIAASTSLNHTIFAATITQRLATRPIEADLRVAFVDAFSAIIRQMATDTETLFDPPVLVTVKQNISAAINNNNTTTTTTTTTPAAAVAVETLAHPKRLATLIAQTLLDKPGFVDGLGGMLTLLAAANHSSRAPLVCRPAPHWLTRTSGGKKGGGSGGGALDSPAEDVNLTEIDEALRGIPYTRVIAAHAALGEVDLTLWLSTTWSFPSLALVYWLLCLAPVRLEKTETPQIQGAAATFILRRRTLLSSSSALLKDHGNDEGETLWDSRTAAQHGVLQTTLFHGTATENAFCMLGLGPRVLSNTRHESSGSLFGEGVYLTGDIAVALTFAERRGVGWAGWTLREGEGRGGRDDKINDGGSGGGGGGGGGGGDDNAMKRSQCPSPHLIPSREGGARARIVMEVTAIASPTNVFVEAGKMKLAGVSGAGPPKGAYIVVGLAEHVCINRVHFFDADTMAAGEKGSSSNHTSTVKTVKTPLLSLLCRQMCAFLFIFSSIILLIYIVSSQFMINKTTDNMMMLADEGGEDGL
jgi:hypothetical protein